MKNKKKKYVVKILILFFLLNNDFFYLIKTKINKKKSILIEVDISKSKIGNRGPSKFVQGIKEILPYNTSDCTFIPLKNIFLINNNTNSNYFFLPFSITESFYNNLIFLNRAKKILIGPSFVPADWNKFPNNKIWKERRILEILNNVKGIVVHSYRVRDYLSKKSKSSQKFIKKYKIVRACTNLKPKNINSFYKRKNDVIFFEKYADLNRSKQAQELLILFRNSSLKIERLVYGHYSKNQMISLANNSKFIIYFSFYDTGAIGLKEIQNFGVFTFSHQKDLIIDNDTCFFVSELNDEFDMTKAYSKIMEKIQNITISVPNMKIIAKKNQEINKCENALNDLCNSILE